jgi:hypothetical protein
MLKHNPLILINSEDKEDNPRYRVLVQTPGELPYPDLDIESINYKEDGIRHALPGLVGYDVVDERTEHERKLGLEPKPFAHIYNTGYCPEYGGYADIEIFHDDYKPVFENMLKNKETSKRKFSTELEPKDIQKVDDGHYDLNSWKYNGLVMTTNPRDEQTGLCDVLLNSKDFRTEEDNDGGNKLPEITEQDIQKLQTKITELEDEKTQIKTEYEQGKTLYESLKPEDFKEYQELLQEKEDLHKQLVPIWTAQEGEKLELVNSLIEKLPEEEREEAKTRFEGMEIEALKIVNSIKHEGTPAPGVVAGGQTPEPKEEDEIPKEDYRKGLGF